mmetsp:Transcript_43593/g.81298  ORF Transcript_43593/g.81298 Transcript_43593/m.81298 type:complete len:212 (+) Transcript_43593:97-732(+)
MGRRIWQYALQLRQSRTNFRELSLYMPQLVQDSFEHLLNIPQDVSYCRPSVSVKGGPLRGLHCILCGVLFQENLCDILPDVEVVIISGHSLSVANLLQAPWYIIHNGEASTEWMVSAGGGREPQGMKFTATDVIARIVHALLLHEARHTLAAKPATVSIDLRMFFCLIQSHLSIVRCWHLYGSKDALNLPSFNLGRAELTDQPGETGVCIV